jgi:hypothetical protein
MLFENRVKAIYDSNFSKIKSLGMYFTFPDLTKTELHPAILKYISSEIDYLIFEDRQKLLSESLFDYSGEKIDEYFEKINYEIKRTKRISQEYVSKLILYSITFNVNFLTRPNWTLQQFIFEKTSSKSVKEIKQILEYLYYYKYLKDVLSAYFDKKKLLTINSEEFEELLKNIQEIGKESYLDKMLNTLLSSTSEFLNQTAPQNTIPKEAVELYLKEKELKTHLEVIHRNFEGSELDIDEAAEVLVEPENYLEVQPENKEKTEEDYELEFEFKETDLQNENKSGEETEFDVSLEDFEEYHGESGEETEEKFPEREETEFHEDSTESLEVNDVNDDVEEEEGIKDKETEYNLMGQDEEESNLEKEDTEEEGNDYKEIIEEDEDKYQEEEIVENETKRDDTENIDDEEYEAHISPKVKPSSDISQFLDSKKINRIVEVVFDYDMDDFLTSMDWIVESESKEDADNKLSKILEDNGIKTSSKEAQILYDVISEYFSNTD